MNIKNIIIAAIAIISTINCNAQERCIVKTNTTEAVWDKINHNPEVIKHCEDAVEKADILLNDSTERIKKHTGDIVIINALTIKARKACDTESLKVLDETVTRYRAIVDRYSELVRNAAMYSDATTEYLSLEKSNDEMAIRNAIDRIGRIEQDIEYTKNEIKEYSNKIEKDVDKLKTVLDKYYTAK